MRTPRKNQPHVLVRFHSVAYLVAVGSGEDYNTALADFGIGFGFAVLAYGEVLENTLPIHLTDKLLPHLDAASSWPYDGSRYDDT